MLRARARAWQDRARPFVCAACRQRLSPSLGHHPDPAVPSTAAAAMATSLQRQLPSRWRTRAFSTTAHCANDSDNTQKPGSGLSRPGTFPGAFSRPAGNWGAFAASVNRSQNGPALGDGLLPHEREARLRSAAAAATPPPKPQAPTAPLRSNQGHRGNTTARSHQPHHNYNHNHNHGHPHNRGQAGKGFGQVRRPDDARADMSRSVLADILNANREPRAPPTPKSWMAGNEDSGATKSTSTPNAARASGSPQSQSRSPSATVARSRHAGHERSHASGHPHVTRHKGKDWGLSGDRKPEISHRAPAHNRHGNDTAASSGGTSRARHPPRYHRQHHGERAHGSNQTSGATNEPQRASDAARQDFWGELETRTTSLKDRFKSTAASPKDAASQIKADEAEEDDTVDASQPVSRGRKSGTETQPSKQRRTSRFDTDEVAQSDDRNGRNSKSSKSNQKSRRISADDDWDDEAVDRWEQKQRRKAEKEALKQKAREEPQVVPIFLPEYISASNLSRAVKQKVDQFLADMEVMGFENITADTIFTGETAALIAMEYGFEPTVDSGSQRDLRPRPVPEDVSLLPSRPPVVTIMGHVDHGKTTLLDWLRKSSVAAQEHGGITQHIGAFVVKMSSGKSITFLDTPGHAAFLSMRQRGANVTDIVVLVVAADDSVKPQTLEALKHATNAKVPIIVAINKIDKEDAKVEQVKADLARHGVDIEDFGGDVQVVCVSGKTGQGMEDLEENIATLSEVLDVRAEDGGMAEGWILESSIKSQGRTATVLVKRGTLRPGDFIVAGQTWARIRTLRNEAGQELSEAPPGTPVEILGWRELPDAGQQVLQSPDEKRAKTAVEYRLEMAEREQSSLQLAEQEQRLRDKAAAAAAAEQAEVASGGAQGLTGSPAEPGVILQNFTVKADVVGSVEAVCGTILELGNHEVRPKILRSSAGPISEYDVDHAAASKSIIVNFNVAIQPHIKQRAEEAGVQILEHNVIYHVVDDAKAALSKLLPMAVSFRVTGEADVVQVFPINVKRRAYQNIAGCRVRNGSIKRSSRVKVLRRGQVVFEGKIDTLKHVKKDVQEMGKNTECGIGLEGFDDFQADDQIQTFEEIKEKRFL